MVARTETTAARKAERARLAAEAAAVAERKLEAGREALLQIAARMQELGYLSPDADEPRVMVPASLLVDLAALIDPTDKED